LKDRLLVTYYKSDLNAYFVLFVRLQDVPMKSDRYSDVARRIPWMAFRWTPHLNGNGNDPFRIKKMKKIFDTRNFL
jgi:hypothetical protein